MASKSEVTEVLETVEVELPTIGRLVHIRIDAGGEDDEIVLRPAIVVCPYDDGSVFVRVFLFVGDIPLPPGAGIHGDAGGYYAVTRYGTECGEWCWPERGEPEFFTANVT